MSRVALGLLALAACAWFALGLRQEAAVREARAVIAPLQRPAPADARRADTALDRAGTLNPDTGVDLLRAQLAMDQGRRVRARRILERVLAREPENIRAWAQFAFTVGPADRAAFRRARARIRALAPRVPEP